MMKQLFAAHRGSIAVAVALLLTALMIVQLDYRSDSTRLTGGTALPALTTAQGEPSGNAEPSATTEPSSPVPTTSSSAPTSAPRPPDGEKPWMRKLEPGEQPPQFVMFSFDGAASHPHWQRFREIARRSGAHVTGLLSGIYLLPDGEGKRYTGPGHKPGGSSIGFGGTPEEVRTTINDLNGALSEGHELGTHYNGHFCQGAEPSVGKWTTAQWNDELDQFFGFVRATPDLKLDPSTVKGGRTPCLEGRMDQLLPALAARGMTYDTSQTARGVVWPRKTASGVWEFPMPEVVMPGLNKRMIMMDYNFWYSLNGAKNEPARAAEFTESALNTYRGAYQAALTGNRAPLVVGNHFNSWNAGAFNSAVESFMGETCGKPDTVCATYSEVIQWMSLQDPAVLQGFLNRPSSG
ncbi:polysaccharide deacetylase [Pseudonocardiaceae bacterium YIM PH 21723]|nr:polysaccharide deacetylase [Pseudonocardiaceae bacterium YIM PH 21723]